MGRERGEKTKVLTAIGWEGVVFVQYGGIFSWHNLDIEQVYSKRFTNAQENN